MRTIGGVKPAGGGQEVPKHRLPNVEISIIPIIQTCKHTEHRHQIHSQKLPIKGEISLILKVQRTLAAQNMTRLNLPVKKKTRFSPGKKEINWNNAFIPAFCTCWFLINQLSFPCLSKVGCNVSTCFPKSNQPKTILEMRTETLMVGERENSRGERLESVVCGPKPAARLG